jgi:phosphohistidine phosphatase
VIWLLRHGDAEREGDEDARRLTEKGERQADHAGRALAELGVRVDACLSSPKIRALDTARIVAGHLGVDAEAAGELAGGEFDPARLAAGRGEVLLVGHEPDLSRAVGDATGGRVEMKKGGLAGIEDRSLVALLRPEQLEAIARGARG